MKKTLTIRLHCHTFPGRQFANYANVYVGVQQNAQTVWETPGDSMEKDFDIPVTVSPGKDGAPNFTGPFVYGTTGDKFLYLVWLDKKGELYHGFRRAKIKLQSLGWTEIERALENDLPLVADVTMTGKKGDPVCASLKSENIRWVVE